jgi:hypothetical protein
MFEFSKQSKDDISIRQYFFRLMLPAHPAVTSHSILPLCQVGITNLPRLRGPFDLYQAQGETLVTKGKLLHKVNIYSMVIICQPYLKRILCFSGHVGVVGLLLSRSTELLKVSWPFPGSGSSLSTRISTPCSPWRGPLPGLVIMSTKVRTYLHTT